VDDRKRGTRLTDPRYCLEQAQKLMLPITKDNWWLVCDDAEKLNILQAAVTHLVYRDAECEEFQEQVLQTVFTAYLMGRAAEQVAAGLPDAFVELIESLDLSGLPG
jgi:hypothetical protein